MSLDPEFSKLSFSDAEKFGGLTNLSWKPYNHNRLGRDNPSIYLGASEVHTEHQDFILASCPRTPDEFVGVLMHFLEKIESHGVWVSLLSSHEAKNYCNNFWKEKFLRQLTFPGGWSIKEVTSSIIGGSFDGSGPSLTKTLIELECGKISKTIVHYHYDKWIDRTVVPDEELLLILLDEMEANSEETSPIVINCIGGVGRTGMTTAAYILRKEIQINLSQGVLPKDVFINVPETLYALLKQRTHLMNDPKHMNKMYTVLAKYYEKISSEKDLLLPDITPQPSRN
jgi:protein tyrosine phosphatase